MSQVFIFGDSITWGAWDREGNGWAQRLRAEIDRRHIAEEFRFWCPLYSLGVSGDTAKGIAARLKSEISARLEQDSNDITILISIGINDSATQSDGRKPDVSAYRKNLEDILKAAKIFTQKIGFIGLFPIDETLLSRWDSSKSYAEESALKYNEICRLFCESAGVPFLNLFEKAAALEIVEFLHDGLHPNTRGHEFIYRQVREFLVESRLLTVPFV